MFISMSDFIWIVHEKTLIKDCFNSNALKLFIMVEDKLIHFHIDIGDVKICKRSE